jgi:hypothetical protein
VLNVVELFHLAGVIPHIHPQEMKQRDRVDPNVFQTQMKKHICVHVWKKGCEEYKIDLRSKYLREPFILKRAWLGSGGKGPSTPHLRLYTHIFITKV